MILLNTARDRHFRTLLKLESPLKHLRTHNPNCLNSLISSYSFDFSLLCSIFRRPFSLAAEFAENFPEEEQNCQKPLSAFFIKGVGPSERTENAGVDAEEANEIAKLKEKLEKLEEEVRKLNEKRHEKGEASKLPSTKKGDVVVRKETRISLSALFADKKRGMRSVKPIYFGNEDPTVHKELSPEMQMFAHHLYMKGYLKDASFRPKNRFDLICFEVSYAREYLEFGAVKFGRAHQEIAKWLSASDLKKIALFGCPSLGKKSIFAAKHMRRFFEIDEQKVCKRCSLKESCEHANKSSKKACKDLRLANVTRVVTLYAMDSVAQQLVVPEEIKNSANRLLKEIINLS